MSLRNRVVVLVFGTALLSGIGIGSSYGQESPRPPAAPPAADAKAVDAPRSDVKAADKDLIREQTIYIPYEKLRKTFEKEGRGVFLPYEKFQELWKAARANSKAAEPPKRPVDALINSIESEATIGDQVVNVTAVLQLEILGEGWVKVPLRLRQSAIRSATIDGQPARLIFDKQTGYQLLYQKQGDKPLQIELKTEYSRKFDKTPGQSSVVFEAPQAPINRWKIRVPEAGMAVQIEPMIAATRVTGKGGKEAGNGGGTDLLAFVGAAPSVRIAWNPKAEGASGLAAFATVQVEQQIVISEGVARSTIRLDYDISRSTLSQLVLEVPAEQKVVNVFDRNVKRWKVEAKEGKQVIRVELFEATQGKQPLLVELETFSDATQSKYDIPAALVRAVGVGRQQGIVVARLDEGLQGEAVKRTGLLQMDQSDLPKSLSGSKWAFSYRYGAVPYELTLRVEKVLPRISVTELIDAELNTNRLTLNWQGVFQIEDAGVFQLRVEIPTDFEVRTIQGKTIGKAQAVAVDSHHREADDGTTWIVNLSKKAFGKTGLSMQLQRTLDDSNLLTPTGNVSTIAIELPRVTPDDVEFAQGTLVLSAPPSLRVNPAEIEGLRNISFGEAYKQIPAAPRTARQVQPVLAYSFAKGDTKFAVTAQRRKPQVTVDQLLRAEIDSGVVKFHAAFYYNVKYSGVKSLRIDIPTSLTGAIRNTNKSIRREELAPQPDGVAEGYTAWSFAAETELLGAAEVNLQWERKIDELGIGKSQEIPIPRLTPQDVDLATGQIVIAKSESIDVQPTAPWEGLIPIDPHIDLRRPVKIDNAAIAFSFVGPWSLQVRATRYELEASKLTSITRGVVRIVVLSQGELSVQAIYRMRSARQRLAIRLAEDAVFDAQPLRINGKPVNAERESATTISAPLIDQDIDETFVLELRYSVKGTPDHLDLPSLPDDPAVQKVYLCVYLPDKQVLLASSGAWSDERGETGLASFDPAYRQAADELIQWVTQSNTPANNSAKTFPIGKSQCYIYSTLRPQEAPSGSLHLRTINRTWFNGVIVLVVVLVGLPLFRKSPRLQLALLLLITAASLLLGVFLPELARSVFSSIFPAAIALLVLIWLIGHASKLRWYRPAPATPAPAATPFADATEADAAAASESSSTEESRAEPAAEHETPGAQPPPDEEPESDRNDDAGTEDNNPSGQDKGGRGDA